MQNTVTIVELSHAAPELFLAAMACLILVVDLYLGARWRSGALLLSLATLVGTIALLTTHGEHDSRWLFNGMFVDDAMADVLKIAICAVTFFVFVYSRAYLADRSMLRGEYFVLGLFGVLGMMVLASASHFLTLYLGLELLALCLYTLVALRRDAAPATEAAMKYFVLGALASGMLLYGMSMIYGATGSLEMGTIAAAVAQGVGGKLILTFGLVFVVVGVGFKLGAVPFHMWVPDVYHGAPTSVTLYISTAPKLAGFAIVMRLLVGSLGGLADAWQDMLMLLAVASIIGGNLVAIAQSNIKRMLAYSTIAHMGFFLLGIVSNTPNGFGSSMFYVLIYAVMSLGAFGMLILMSNAGFEAERLDDLKGLNQRSRWHAFLMLLVMFSMAGVPPTAGFFAKLMVIQALVDVGRIGLAVFAVLFAVVGAYYYLRVVKLIYFDPPDGEGATARPGGGGLDMQVLLAVNCLSLVLVLPWIGKIIELCTQAVARIG